MDKPAFDPTQPFSAASDKPAFDPTQPFEAAPQVGRLEDAAKSIGSGLGNATISTLGLPGDLSDYLARGSQAASNLVADKLGWDRGPQIGQGRRTLSDLVTGEAPKPPGWTHILPTSQDIRSTVTDPVVSPDYQPQYESGKYLKRGAEFASLATQPGGPVRRLLNVAVPAAGSVIGEEVGGPIGGVAGALAGGVGLSAAARKFQQMGAARQAASALPAGEELGKSGSAGFETHKASDAVMNPSSIENMAKDIKTEMLNEGKHPSNNGQAGVFATLDRLEAMGAAPGGVTTKDMEVIRKSLVDQKKDLASGPTARMATDKFMEKYSNLGQADLLHGTNTFPILKNAVDDWSAFKRWETVQGKRNLAELNQNSPVGMLDSATGGQALQRTMKQLARPVNNTNMPVARKLGFNNEEVAAITEAASGTKMQRAAELLDRLVPAKLGAIPAAIARQIGGLTTKRQVAALDSLVRSRSALAAQVAAQLPPQVVAQLPSKTQRILQTMRVASPAVKNAIQPAAYPVGQSNP